MSINTQKILGDLTPQQQPYSYGRRSDGRWSKVIYASLSEAQINNIAAQADLLGINYEFSNNFGSRSEISLDYNWNFINSAFNSAATEAEETWEIVPSKVMKPLLESNNQLVLQAIADAYGQVEDLRFRVSEATLGNYIKDPSSGLIAIQTWGTAANLYSASGMQLYQILLTDPQAAVELPAPVMTHTKIVTAQYINPATFTNIGNVISTPTLITSEGIPGGLLFDIASLPSTNPPPQPIGITGYNQVFNYGWLKNSPSVRQVAKRKWSITQTWDYGLWNTSIYGNAL